MSDVDRCRTLARDLAAKLVAAADALEEDLAKRDDAQANPPPIESKHTDSEKPEELTGHGRF